MITPKVAAMTVAIIRFERLSIIAGTRYPMTRQVTAVNTATQISVRRLIIKTSKQVYMAGRANPNPNRSVFVIKLPRSAPKRVLPIHPKWEVRFKPAR
jgi:hypothetical protein